MLDWLRKDQQDPQVELAGRTLPINIRRHARANKLTMRLAPDGSELRITIPRWARTRDALVFVEARRAWIEQQLARIPAAISIAHGSRLPYRGNPLTIHWQEKAPRRPRLDDGLLHIGGPADTLEARTRHWLEGEAVTLLKQDLAFYCERGGENLPDLRLSRAQRRWGSCTSEREGGRCIRINWRLVMAPDAVRRSVVAHEVAHLTHFDHSPAFHARLRDLFEGDIAAADRWLKAEGRGLYAAFG